MKLPGSFTYERKNLEKIQIKYYVEFTLEGLEDDIGHKKEFIVREFNFTD